MSRPKKPAPKKLANTHVKMGFRKHVLPPLTGLLVMFLIFGFFNSEFISGRIAYELYTRKASASPAQSEVVATPLDKNAPPRIRINDIQVDAPIIFDQETVNEAAFQTALRSGVVHYPGTAVPGQTGNVVIFGHSSGQWWTPGNYKFVFTLLDKLKVNDRIFIEYQGTRYIYRITTTSVVKPSDTTVLNQGPGNMLTLITCTPVGTSTNRLIIQAQQVVPKVSTQNQATDVIEPKDSNNKLPSNSPSIWHDLRQLF